MGRPLTPGTPDSLPWCSRRIQESRLRTDRGEYEVDRDRIVHSETFRELQYKTQVQSLVRAAPEASFRTRLNHVIEVAQLSRSIARLLGGTEPLAEGIALAHDLGHPPFGHAGERALRRELLAHHEPAWNANVHSLAVVDKVESMYLDFPGLNLTWATREGIARHSTPFDEPVTFGEFVTTAQGGLECQIVDAADVLAYLSHDLDDALSDGFIGFEALSEASRFLASMVEEAEARWTERAYPWEEDERDRLVRRFVVAKLIAAAMEDMIGATSARLRELGVEEADDIRVSEERSVVYSDEFADLTQSVLKLLTERYYRSATVKQADAFAEESISALFEWYLANPDQIPQRFRVDGPAAGVATYIASLNDRTAAAKVAELGLVPLSAKPDLG
jgi:dGTPase